MISRQQGRGRLQLPVILKIEPINILFVEDEWCAKANFITYHSYLAQIGRR